MDSPFNDPMPKDPRFAYKWRYTPNGWVTESPNPEEGGSFTNPKANPIPWVDLPQTTQLGDMRAIAAGHSGTSEGDRQSPLFIRLVNQLMYGRGPQQVTPEDVNNLKLQLMMMRIPHFMQTHPGKAAYYDR